MRPGHFKKMTKEQKDIAISDLKLPPDYLDTFWPIFFGFLSMSFCLLGCLGFILIRLVNGIIVPAIISGFFIFFTIQFILSIYFFRTERRLTTILTCFGKQENDEIVENALKSLKWKINGQQIFIDARKNFSIGRNVFVIKILTDDSGIYYNIRNQGSKGIRFMHSFGFESLKAFQLRKKLEYYADNKLFVKESIL